MIIDKKKINHLGIIMDGNRRWAAKKNLPLLDGYKAGVKIAEQTVEFAILNQISNLTLYTMSAENLKRPKDQLSYLFSTLENYLLKDKNVLKDKKVRLQVVGDIEKLPQSLQKAINQAEEESKNNTQLNLYLAINYGGRQEILDACKKMLSSKIKADELNAEEFERYLYAPQMPDLDYVIRTGDNERISDFLLWKISYAELCFLKVLWPDVTKKHLKEAIGNFQNRSRTFGVNSVCKV
jgi:undecaprenyl diphosphate synthase